MEALSIAPIEQALRETPPAARYLDCQWSRARSWIDWFRIRQEMLACAIAVAPYSRTDSDDYQTLSAIASAHSDRLFDAEMALHAGAAA